MSQNVESELSGIRISAPDGRSRPEFEQYRRYLSTLGTSLGEVMPLPGETPQEIRTLLRVAAWSLGFRCRTWLDEGRVYVYLLHERLRA